MKKYLLMLALLGAQAVAQSTGACHNAMAINKYGQPTGGAKVKVCADAACATTLPTIYSDSGLTTQKPNPFGADSDGNYTWCAPLGSHFFEQVTYGNSVKLLDTTLPGGGAALSVNGNHLNSADLNDTFPGPDSGMQTCKWKWSGSSAVCQVPLNSLKTQFVGAWLNNTFYGGWEAVSENGTLYFALQPSVGQDPMYSAAYWQAAGVNTGATNQWTGNQKFTQLNSNTFYVSAYGSIQGAINNAVALAGQAATVVDDRTTNYSGPGFYVVDGITVLLASVGYNFTAPTTYNNGNNNVTAAIVLDQGAHLKGASTSSNHGTMISVAPSWTNDIIATASVGTGIGGTALWWHWGSIENLNINGANQTAGECVHVENMGETAKLANLLLKNCYTNNLEIVGASATQSDIENISSFKSQMGSGVRFTNLAGVAKINGLSGDCNHSSLVSVQENAAGSLTILGLKSEAEVSVCSDSLHHDPVILMDGLTGFNDHVKIIGGYAFGTAQQNFAKFINAGNAILELEGVYITGYTNILNDTVRSVVVPATSSNIKQPFFYEPGGTTYSNQAFTFLGGTFLQGQNSTTPTEIFGLTTSGQTLLAGAGNGDNSSVASGGIGIMGHNRTMYGTPPELMARWGYRWLGVGLGYDTTKFDLVPAWKSGDTTEKNIGSTLTDCQVGSTSVSCRWSNIYSLNLDTNTLVLNGSAVAPSTVNPLMDGTATPGTSTNFAREGHVHPTDTSLVPKTTTVNGHALSGNVTVTAGDVGAHHNVSGTMQSVGSPITGNSGYQTVYSFTLPAGTFAVGQGARCSVRWTHNSGGSVAINFQWQLGSTAYTAQPITSGASASNIGHSEIEIYTPSSLSSQVSLVMPLQQGGATPVSGTYNSSSENLTNSTTLKFSFNVANTEQITPIFGYCETIQ